MPLPDALIVHDRARAKVALATLLGARRAWDLLGSGDWDVAWRAIGPQLVALLTASQIAVGRLAETYVDSLVDEVGIPAQTVGALFPAGLAGTASDGRPLDTLVYESVIGARIAGKAGGLDTATALDFGRRMLDRIVTTQVSDASRDAVSVASVTRPAIEGMVRVANPPCCSRCAVLAGNWYRWSQGFDRHPGDDCTMIPGTRADSERMYRDDPRANTDRLLSDSQVHDLSKADAKAIADGADPNQVINARRGMTIAGGLKATTEGTTRRGQFGRSQRDRIRLRPQAIYDLATDRDDAIRMLRQYRYII